MSRFKRQTCIYIYSYMIYMMYYVEYIVTNRIIEAKFGQILSVDFKGHVDFYDEFLRRSAFCGQRFWHQKNDQSVLTD